MPNNCIIVGCTNREGKNGVHMYRIPSIRESKGSQIKDLTERRQSLWLAAIQRKGFDKETTIKSCHRVCSDHFIKGKPASFLEETDPDWVPSLKLGHGLERICGNFLRLQERNKKKEALQAAAALLDLSTQHTTQECESKPTHKEMAVQTDISGSQLDAERKAFQDKQCELVHLRKRLSSIVFDEIKFTNNDEETEFYTGLPSWVHFTSLITYLSPALSHEGNSLSKFQEILLVLMKLRLGLMNRFISDIFNINESTVSRTFLRVLNIMYFNMKSFIIWPARECLQKTMPLEFIKYFNQRVTVIIDCFEFFIEHPNNSMAKAKTYSNYKGTNTIKYLIGITPQGAVSYISQGWDGKTSDKHIVENSDFLSFLDQGDLVLADRGFNVHDSIGLMCAELKIPAFTHGKKQLSAWEVDATRQLAHLRIHVERVIGRLRNRYAIFNTKIPLDYLMTEDEGFNTLDQIITVCAALTNINMNQSVVPLS